MRRRTWALVRMCDVVFSHQVSLPNMIYDHDCDTQLPNNIFDEEFGPDTKILPPSRPRSEPTPIGYMIAKVELCNELGNILQATNRVGKQIHYDEILRFDARLQDIRDALPPHLKMQPLEGSHDPLTLIIARFNIDILYQKIVCLLHRKYLARARQHPRYAHSRKAAIEASLETLRHLAVLHRESQPSGRLRSIKWWVTSIATKDFLLAAMLVILDLHYDNTARQDAQARFFWTQQQRREMISSLETTRDIWENLVGGSMEAVKAYNVLKIMLEKLKTTAPLPAESIPARGSVAVNFNLFDRSDSDVPALRQDENAAMTLGMMSGGGAMSPSTAALLTSFQSPTGGGSLGGYAVDMNMSSSSGTGGSGMTPDFSGDLGMGMGMGPVGSPFSSMFNTMGDGVDLAGSFDWVRCPPMHRVLYSPHGLLTPSCRRRSRTTHRAQPGVMTRCSSFPTTRCRSSPAGARVSPHSPAQAPICPRGLAPDRRGEGGYDEL